MTKREENVFTMFTSVDNYLKENQTAIADIPAFADSIDEFTLLIPKIRAKDIEYTNASNGSSLTKDEAEEAMVEAVIPVSMALKIYAKKSGLNDLLTLVKISYGKLKNMRDNDMLSRIKAIAAKGTEYLEVAVNYGLKAEAVTALNEKIAAYESAVAVKDNTSANRSALRRELSSLIEEANEILRDEIDDFAELYEDTNPAFYNGYKSASVIRDV